MSAVCQVCGKSNKKCTHSTSQDAYQGDCETMDIRPPLKLTWKKITAWQLDCDHTLLYDTMEADRLLQQCEDTLVYNTGDLTRLKVCGKWHNIPRKQVAQGDAGLSYTFSGTTVPARAWTPVMQEIRSRVQQASGHQFNFVLINRYKDGHDHIGEHKDDEKDLENGSPIASLTLGQERDFIFRHESARGKQGKSISLKRKRHTNDSVVTQSKASTSSESTMNISPVKVLLQHGCLLIMNYPTNHCWYHSVPVRKRLNNVRINMTFRKMLYK